MFGILKKGLVTFLEKFVVLILFIMVTTVFCGIIARFVLKVPLVWAEELALVCQIWLTFMAASMLYASGEHMVVEAILIFLSKKRRLALALVNHIMVIPLFIAFIIGGFQVFAVTVRSVMPGLGVSVAVMYIPAILGGFFMLFFSFDLILQVMKELSKLKQPAVEEGNAE